MSRSHHILPVGLLRTGMPSDNPLPVRFKCWHDLSSGSIHPPSLHLHSQFLYVYDAPSLPILSYTRPQLERLYSHRSIGLSAALIIIRSNEPRSSFASRVCERNNTPAVVCTSRSEKLRILVSLLDLAQNDATACGQRIVMISPGSLYHARACKSFFQSPQIVA